MSQSIFRSAITNESGIVDAGYLSLFWIMAVVIMAIPFMCVFTAAAMWLDPLHEFDVQSLGIGIGSVCTGFGVAVGAVGAFRLGDKPAAATPGVTTTKETIVKTEQMDRRHPPPPNGGERGTPAKPLHVAVELEDEPTPKRAAAKRRK